MRIKNYGFFWGLLLAGIGSAAADTDAQPSHANVSAYGVYGLLGSGPQGGSFSANGGGGGVAGQINLPGHIFAESSYQYVHENGTENGSDATAGANQIRGGLGLLFNIEDLPVALFAKVQYVHYEFQPTVGGVKDARVSDDGAGVDIGARYSADRFKLYAGGGYLNIGQKRGSEVFAKLELPFGPRLYGFGEYRYDWLGAGDAADKLRLIDYHLGVGFRF